MAEMNGPAQPGSGSQPASGGMNGGSVTGGFEMIMGMGGGAGVSPPCSNFGGLSMTDVTLEQALSRMQELARENGELREYLKENNDMMKKQFETLSQWKQKVHDANVMNREKFEQTRALITSLRAENEELQVSMRDTTNKEDSLVGRIKSLGTELTTLKTAKAASDQLAYNVVKQAEQQGVEVGEEEAHMGDTVYVASAEKEGRIMELEAEVESVREELSQLKERCTHLEHDNSQFRSNTEQLLKDLESTQVLKQQIQKENQDLRQETVELRQQLQCQLAERGNSLQRNQKGGCLLGMPHLGKAPKDESNVPIDGNTREGSMGRTPERTADDWQGESAAVTAEVEQLRKQLAAEKSNGETLNADRAAHQLEISQLQGQIELQQLELDSLRGQHEERVRQLQKEHEHRVEHMERQRSQDSSLTHKPAVTATHAEDVQTLRSQVLTLINEVHETQNKLAAAQRVIETKSARAKDLEVYSSQVVEDSRIRTQQFQQSLAMGERRLIAEQQDHTATKQQMNDLRQSFNQLVSDYKEVLDTFDQYKAEQEQRSQSTGAQKQYMDSINHLTAQVLAAEEAINVRQEKLDKLGLELKEKDETVGLLQAQADVFKCDFTAEREERTRLATEKDRLMQELEAEQLKNQGLADQLTHHTQKELQAMQVRASQGSVGAQFYPPSYPYPATQPQGSPGQQQQQPPQQHYPPTSQAQQQGYPATSQAQQQPYHPYQAPTLHQQHQQRPNPATSQQQQQQQQQQRPPYPAGGGGDASGAGGGDQVGQSMVAEGGGNYAAGQNYSPAPHHHHPHHPPQYPGGQRYGNGQQSYFGAGQQSMAGGQSYRRGGGGQSYGPGQAGFSPHPQQGGQPRQPEEEEYQYICPCCQQRLPDSDTLQIHVQDCLESQS